MKKLLSLVLLSAVLTSCGIGQKGEDGKDGQPSKSATAAGSYQILKQAANGGREAKSNEIITSQQQLDALYKELALGPAPTVDFTSMNVIALFLGQKNTGGYSVDIASVIVDDNTAKVKLQETRPDGMATMALTQPYCIAAITKTAEVLFE